MILIGFTWIIIPCIAASVITKVAPGQWEDRGPTVFMLTSVASAFAGMICVLITHGINGYGPPSTSAASLGVGISVLGGLIAFVGYVFDVRRQQQA